MAVRTYSANEKKFFQLAREICGEHIPIPIPLRRVLSLMRISQEKCKSIVHETTIWGKNCPPEACAYRKRSCKDYEENLIFYNYKLINKCCHKLLFFKSEKENGQELKEEDLLGYCIIQQDKIENLSDKNNKLRSRTYVTECVLNTPLPRSIKGFSYGNYKTEISVDGKSFKVKGNYFSQQNAITNCCAQAAVKMAIRGYYPETTCEKINETIEISHNKKEGNKGLTPHQITAAVEGISNQELKTYMLNANDLGYPSDFLKVVYLALESKIPVILLFHLKSKTKDNFLRGHAVTLIGHTFNRHNWGAYAGAYFSNQELGYLSSFLWCDNFVVQDDNFGPFYQISARFLTDYVEFARSRDSFEKYMMVRTPLASKPWHKDPLYAIFIYPKELSFLKDNYLVETVAVTIFNKHVNELASNNELPTEEEDFNTYFYDNFKYGPDRVTSAIITRTLLVRKEEYLNLEVKKIYEENSFGELIDCLLPEHFWVTEISVPELYWINFAKVGEIVIDPIIFNESPEDSIILIRLPYFFSFFEKGTDNKWDYKLKQDEPYQDIIKKAKGLIR